MTKTKSIVDIDLLGYSTIARALEESIAPTLLVDLNRQIQGFVDAGLEAAGIQRSAAILSNTGDGAILMFDLADHAHRFAVGLHQSALAWSAPKAEPMAGRFFRIGVATGPLEILENEGGREFGGMVIARSVRLQARAEPGSILIDEATASSLSAGFRHLYSGPVEVAGKRDELFVAYSLAVDRPKRAALAPLVAQPAAFAFRATRGAEIGKDIKREVLRLLRSLRPHQYDELIFLLGMPIDRRPPRLLPAAERRGVILDWVGEDDSGVQSLYDDLLVIVGD